MLVYKNSIFYEWLDISYIIFLMNYNNGRFVLFSFRKKEEKNTYSLIITYIMKLNNLTGRGLTDM